LLLSLVIYFITTRFGHNHHVNWWVSSSFRQTFRWWANGGGGGLCNHGVGFFGYEANEAGIMGLRGIRAKLIYKNAKF
ncbi:Uncharacterized protein TCM_045967, partial [Theobroma cacao]